MHLNTLSHDPSPIGRIGPDTGLGANTGRNGDRPRLLLADDSDVIREHMAPLLESAGYDVTTAEDGAAALDRLQVGGIDLLVLDLQMPNVDGFDVLERLQEAGTELPVILLSGLPAAAIQDRLGRLHAQRLPPLFLKPVDFDQLAGIADLLLNGDLPDLDD